MNRFKQTNIKDLNPTLINRSASKNCQGFTLIELLTAISIIAILIALLLPVIQRTREEYAAAKAEENLRMLMVASNEYFNRLGSYPDELEDLAQYCATNPGSCSLNAQLASGKIGGYNIILAYRESDFNITAEPEYPGITGSYTLTIGPNFMVTRESTPGSDAARQQAFDNILANGAATAVQLLALNSNAASEIREYTESPATLTTVFNTIDTNRDSEVSVLEINSFTNTTFDDEALKRPLNAFLGGVFVGLKLDSLSEQDSQAVRVGITPVYNGDDSLLSYNGLRSLTQISVADGTSNTILLAMTAKLDAAEAAEANGNLNRKAKSLKQYKQLVKAQIGLTLTRANATTLITISTTL
jgi:prepilin-type N-terminal cleavage/methylation domain-containing protein